MDISKYIDATVEELDKMTARQLMGLRKQLYGSTYKCSCYRHCGDEVLPKEQQEHNKKIYALQARILEVLPNKEHVPNKIEAKAARQARAKRRF